VKVPTRYLLVTGKTSIIITVLIWCWPRIHDILLCYTSMQRPLTSEWGWPSSSFYPSCYTWNIAVPIYRLVSVFFSAKFNFSVILYWYFFINIYQGNKVIKKNTEIYSVLKCTVLCDVIALLLWFLQYSEREAVSPGFWRMSIFRVSNCCSADLKLLSIHQECLQ